jgi:thiamine kinase-like enzyme
MVDFEYCRLGPAVYDLAYFLFSGVSEDDLEHFDGFQKCYNYNFWDYLI